MKQFKIGNPNRGYVKFSAKSTTKAWDIGCRKFNKQFKVENCPIILYEIEMMQTIRFNKVCWNEDCSMIIFGYSDQKY